MEPIAQLKLAHWRSVQKTSSYAIQGQDSRSGFYNLNAPTNIILTLPRAVVGGVALQYKFLVSTAHTITVTPKIATDTIRGKAAGASATNATPGSFLSLICVQPGFWEPEINNGSW